MKSHKDLPAGSQNWAGDVAGQLAKIAELEGIVRRLVNDFGLDYSNPQRGLNTGNAPSVANPVQLKLPSLKDLDIRDAQDGDLLTFDGKRGVWTARRHDTVVLPKVFPEGDPASYYVPSAGVGTYAENVFPNPEGRTPNPNIDFPEVPKWFEFSTTEIQMSTVSDGGGYAVRMTNSGNFEFSDGLLQFLTGYLDITRDYVFSWDLVVPSPAPAFYGATPIRALNSGDSVKVPASAITEGTRRMYAYIPPGSAMLNLNAKLAGTGYVEWKNFQATEIPAGFRRVTGNTYPTNETIDVTANVTPGKTYLVHDLCDSISPLSFSIEATGPLGSTVLWSRDESQWPQALVTVPADATSVSYSTVKPSDGWHNVNIVEAPPEFFEGSMAADTNYTYSWAGTSNDSTSIRTPK